MERILTLDMQDYTEDMPVLEVFAARAIIRRDGRIAMQLGNNGEYKIPGGRLEPGETILEALIREVQEETGLLVKMDTVQEIGEVLEKRRDVKDEKRIYVCHSYCFICDVEEKTVPTCMTEKEKAKGFHLVWETPEHIIAQNERLLEEERFPKNRRRDTEFLKLTLPWFGGKMPLYEDKGGF